MYTRWCSVHGSIPHGPGSPAEGMVLPIVAMGLPTSIHVIKSFSEAGLHLPTPPQACPEAPLPGESRGYQVDS